MEYGVRRWAVAGLKSLLCGVLVALTGCGGGGGGASSPVDFNGSWQVSASLIGNDCGLNPANYGISEVIDPLYQVNQIENVVVAQNVRTGLVFEGATIDNGTGFVASGPDSGTRCAGESLSPVVIFTDLEGDLAESLFSLTICFKGRRCNLSWIGAAARL